jgi:hypothetical protein
VGKTAVTAPSKCAYVTESNGIIKRVKLNFSPAFPFPLKKFETPVPTLDKLTAVFTFSLLGERTLTILRAISSSLLPV